MVHNPLINKAGYFLGADVALGGGPLARFPWHEAWDKSFHAKNTQNATCHLASMNKLFKKIWSRWISVIHSITAFSKFAPIKNIKKQQCYRTSSNPKCEWSGQIIIFHQPRFSWNNGISLKSVVWGRYNLTRMMILWVVPPPSNTVRAHPCEAIFARKKGRQFWDLESG